MSTENTSGDSPDQSSSGFLSHIIEVFLRGRLAVIISLLSLIIGVVALAVTPREEEPQIVVPIADIIVSVPGASARQIERQVASRLEKLLYQVEGVEYVYSQSRDEQAVVTARFYVGENLEDSLVNLQTKLARHVGEVAPSVESWVVRPIGIDDVPIVEVALFSAEHSDVELRRIAEELELRLQAVRNTGPTRIVGGRSLVARVDLDAERLAGHGLGIADLESALRGANVHVRAGDYEQLDRSIMVDVGPAFRTTDELEGLVVGIEDGHPIALRDVADVVLGPRDVSTYTRFGWGAAAEKASDGERVTSVTIAVAKKAGTNAVRVSSAVQDELARLAPILLPDGVEWHVMRDDGHSANEKVNELLESLLVAVVIVIGLIAFTLGWREGLVVAAAVPITFALTLFINLIAGYTINRVTLFALILSLGLVVDDPIVDVENIHRHFRMRKEKPLDAVLTAVNEVRPPVILATLAVIISFLPMSFITGMMGPYMRPMALNVPLAMLMSLVVAFTITPWMSYHALRHSAHKQKEPVPLHRTLIYRVYAATMRPLMHRRIYAWGVLLVTVLLFGFSGFLAANRSVPLKMLPFDNKDRLQITVDMPEGTTLERTAAVVDELASYTQRVNEVRSVATYVGTSSPIDFNGLVRQAYLRAGPHVGEVRLELVRRDSRRAGSHEIALRFRDDLTEIAQRAGAVIRIVEAPPGPPVVATLTVEVTGEPWHDYEEIVTVAAKVAERFALEPGVVEVDTSIEARQPKMIFEVDREKAALAGLDSATIARALKVALGGADVGTLRAEDEVMVTPIHLRLPVSDRSDPDRLASLYVAGGDGDMIQLGELGKFVETETERAIFHKNLEPVVYVFADVVGRTPAEAILDMHGDLDPGGGIVPTGFDLEWAGEGEWKITLDVFRDLGIAFGVACIGIYILLVHQTGSFFLPLILMISIPLTIVGIMPGFWLLNLITAKDVGGYASPVFFTATAMIGMIALSGIAVRNAILLIDFIQQATAKGVDMEQAILESGAVRIRPIILTAGTAMLAALPITLDPVFSGLAWALIFGLFVSTAFTLVLIPMIYWMVHRREVGRE